MRRVLLVTAWLVCALLAGTRTAAAEPVADGIGIYCDVNASGHCCYAASYALLTMYVVASNLSEPAGIGCWEAKVLYEPAAWPAGLTWSVCGEGAVFVPQDAPVFRVCIPAGLAAAPAVPLLSFTTFYLGGPKVVGLGPVVPSMVEGAGPAYSPADAPTRWRAFQVLCGRSVSWAPWPGEPNGFGSASINTACADPAVDERSWSLVKRLYD